MKNKRFIVMGLGEFGRALAPELARLGGEVLAVDISPRKVESVRDQVTMAVVADIRDRAALQELITSTFDVAILAIGGSLEARSTSRPTVPTARRCCVASAPTTSSRPSRTSACAWRAACPIPT